jgi:exonuclease VII large subunit
VVIWRDKAQRLSHMPSNGEQISAHGKISVYGQGGRHQLYADAMQLAEAQGDLSAQFRALWAKLEAATPCSSIRPQGSRSRAQRRLC